MGSYQLKGVAQVWFNQQKEERGLMWDLLIGKNSKECFLIISFHWNERSEITSDHQPTTREYECEEVCCEVYSID